MENFDHQQQGNVKEKQFYLLHLDTPRIIIVASVIIGLVVISFLMGMNFIGDNGSAKQLASDKMLFNEKGGTNFLNEDIPSPPHGELDKKPFDDKLVLGDEPESDDKKNNKIIAKGSDKSTGKTASSDMLSSDEINEIIPPIPEEKKEPVKNKYAGEKKKSDVRKVVRKRKAPKKQVAKKKRRKSRVIEVSDNTGGKARIRSGYAIQIASFDTHTRAKREMKRLHGMKYDAYIESSRVSGKKYYRVRVGTISNRKKAIRLLNEIQDKERYKNSYMIKE